MYQQINLYQPIFRKQRQIFSAVTMLQALGIVAVALLGLYGYGVAKVSALEADVVQLEGSERALTTQLMRFDPALGRESPCGAHAELKRLNATLLDQQRLIDVLRMQPLGDAAGFSGYLAALARHARRSSGSPSSRSTAAPGQSSCRGEVLFLRLCRILQRLGSEAALAGQRFDLFEIERDSETGESMFRATSRAAALALADNGERQRP